MIPASPQYKDALRLSHVAETRAVIMNPTANNTYEDGETLLVQGGNLNIDGTRNIWRTGSLNLAPDNVFFTDPLDQVTGATRLRIDRGIRMFSGFVEWVTIATVQVQQATRALNQGTLSVQVSDLGCLVQDYSLQLWQPQESAEPLTVVAAIQQVVEAAMWETPVWKIDGAVDSAMLLPEFTVFEGDRWTVINKMAKGLGAMVYADYEGAWNIRMVIDPAKVTNFQAIEGTDGILVNRSTNATRRECYNGVRVTWETPEGSGSVFVVDSNPASPTYWDGPWGRKTAPEQRLDTVTTEAQATIAAYSILDGYKGMSQQIELVSVHDPLIEPFDVLTVRGTSLKGAPEAHVMDSIAYPLSGGQMGAKTRQVS